MLSGKSQSRIAQAAAILSLAIILTPDPALAYIGPGLGAGAIGVVLGVIGSIFLAVFAVIYYPIKRALKKRRKAAGSTPKQDNHVS